MRLRWITLRRRILPVTVGAVLLVFLIRTDLAHADERRTFCGRTAEEWVRSLQDRTHRGQAVVALGYIGPAARAAVPELVDILRRRDFHERTNSETLVIDALARIGPDASPAVPLLTEKFRKEECFHAKTGYFGYSLFSGAKHALVRIGAASVPALVKALEDLDGSRRPCAAEALGEIGPPAGAAIPALVRALHVERPKPDLQGIQSGALRRQAIIALGRIGPEAKTAVPVLNALLDQDVDDSLEIVLALDRIGAPPVGILLETFHRTGEAYLLGRLGSKAQAAAPTLRRALTDERIPVRVEAAKALAFIDPSSREAIPVLIDALNHHPDQAFGVSDALARFGPAADPAIPSLIANLTPDSVRSLVQIDTKGRRCIPALIGALRHEDTDVVFAATESLGLLGTQARAAVPALVRVIGSDLGDGSSNCEPRVSAVKALVRIDPDAPTVIPALIDALRCRKTEREDFKGEKVIDLDCSASETAAKILGSFGPRARAAVPVLTSLLRNRRKDDYYTTTYFRFRRFEGVHRVKKWLFSQPSG